MDSIESVIEEEEEEEVQVKVGAGAGGAPVVAGVSQPPPQQQPC